MINIVTPLHTPKGYAVVLFMHPLFTIFPIIYLATFRLNAITKNF